MYFIFLYQTEKKSLTFTLCCSICPSNVSSSSGRLPWKRKLCSASANHSSRIWTVEWNSSACSQKTHSSQVCSKCIFHLMRLCSTWHRACSSRPCLDTERLHTVSQRVLSSCIWTLTHEESSWVFSISSLAERLRACTPTVRFPSSFWKTWHDKIQIWVQKLPSLMTPNKMVIPNFLFIFRCKNE